MIQTVGTLMGGVRMVVFLARQRCGRPAKADHVTASWTRPASCCTLNRGVEEIDRGQGWGKWDMLGQLLRLKKGVFMVTMGQDEPYIRS